MPEIVFEKRTGKYDAMLVLEKRVLDHLIVA